MHLGRLGTMNYRRDQKIVEVLQEVFDPEMPDLSIIDLGLVRNAFLDSGVAKVEITPTYLACPAIEEIERQIKLQCSGAGFTVTISRSIDPPWSTEDITERGRQKLESIGVAPPLRLLRSGKGTNQILCPFCNSKEIECISEIGSTACKALYKCLSCLEPFDYFKCL